MLGLALQSTVKRLRKLLREQQEALDRQAVKIAELKTEVVRWQQLPPHRPELRA